MEPCQPYHTRFHPTHICDARYTRISLWWKPRLDADVGAPYSPRFIRLVIDRTSMMRRAPCWRLLLLRSRMKDTPSTLCMTGGLCLRELAPNTLVPACSPATHQAASWRGWQWCQRWSTAIFGQHSYQINLYNLGQVHVSWANLVRRGGCQSPLQGSRGHERQNGGGEANCSTRMAGSKHYDAQESSYQGGCGVLLLL